MDLECNRKFGAHAALGMACREMVCLKLVKNVLSRSFYLEDSDEDVEDVDSDVDLWEATTGRIQYVKNMLSRSFYNDVSDVEIDDFDCHRDMGLECTRFRLLLNLNEDIWANLFNFLDGKQLSLMLGVNKCFNKLCKNETVWKNACKLLPNFCQEDKVEISVGISGSWQRVYWGLRRDQISEINSDRSVSFVHRSQSDVVINKECIKFTGDIGGDRAIRSTKSWTIPPSSTPWDMLPSIRSSKFALSAYSQWFTPPLLIKSPKGYGQAEYQFTDYRYFEAAVLSPSAADPASSATPATQDGNWCVAVGLSTDEFPLEGMQPGWDHCSLAYHSDDGHVFFGNRHVATFPRFGPGDVVGCGLRADRRVFFTLNGCFLGFVHDLPPAFWARLARGAGRLSPTLGIDSPCPIVVNLGRRPFAFAGPPEGWDPAVSPPPCSRIPERLSALLSRCRGMLCRAA